MLIQILISQKNNFQLEQDESNFFYSYFLRFLKKYDLKVKESGVLEIKNQLADQLISFFENAIKDLITDCYVPPTARARQKHSSRYERIYFEGVKLSVDYTTSVIGRLLYLFSWRIAILKEAVNNGDQIEIRIENNLELFFFPS
jgi:hypothetical protein